MLVTGGTGKLGRAFVNFLVDENWHVLVTSTDRSRGQQLKSEVKTPDNVDVFVCDLMSEGASNRLADEILERGHTVNHLVNNARSLLSLKVGADGFSSRQDIADEFLLDVIVPYELACELYLRQRESLKSVINIGSQYGCVAANPTLYEGDSTQSPIQYGLAKSALSHLTKELAVRFGKDDIRVNCIAYGGVEGRADESFKRRYSRLTPIGRMLREEEVLGPLGFLLSEASSSITGQTISADGGWTIW